MTIEKEKKKWGKRQAQRVARVYRPVSKLRDLSRIKQGYPRSDRIDSLNDPSRSTTPLQSKVNVNVYFWFSHFQVKNFKKIDVNL